MDRSEEVVEKILRRAEVAKMTRLLQQRLALASFKAKHGWENLDMDTIEPKLETELKRKRPASSSDMLSDTSSSVSDQLYPTGTMSSSSPLTAPIFSDEVTRSGSSFGHQRRKLHSSESQRSTFQADARKRARSMSNNTADYGAPRHTWKTDRRLPQSSPVYHRQHAGLPASHGANLSFVSSASTIPMEPSSPNFATISDDEDQDLPMHSFQVTASQIRSSPPRTPPPTRARSARFRDAHLGSSVSHDPETGEEGADLLLYLATSPSPANPAMKARVFPPSTPPSQSHALPSSMMTTPNGHGVLAGFGPNTPSPAFNFADFVNITPSPAQVAWTNRTPANIKTPLAAREARRKLNFDALVPPSSSPNLNNLSAGNGSRQTGLGMELGGELIS
ncbi:MAG: hypothetical protein M1833_005041 [Piccolia ochrophora]|nr:MAG: hypothetical protein M1833_005041 [Piccolia ochrophora]